jgi:hypothetical protein
MGRLCYKNALIPHLFGVAAEVIRVNRAQFWTLNLASLVLAGIIGFEMYSSAQLDEMRERLILAEAPVLQFEQAQPLARNMVNETARAAARDPALKTLLAKYGFQVDPPVPVESLHAEANP